MSEQEIEQMKELLRRIAYPRRGTEEAGMDIYEAAAAIQAAFTLEQLESAA